MTVRVLPEAVATEAAAPFVQDRIAGRDPERTVALVPIGNEKRGHRPASTVRRQKAGSLPGVFQPMIEPCFKISARVGTRSSLAFRNAGEQPVFAGPAVHAAPDQDCLAARELADVAERRQLLRRRA